MRNYFLSSILLVALLSCAPQGGRVTAHIDGWGNDTVFVEHYSILKQEERQDTVYAHSGRFSYSLPTDDFTALIFYRKADMFPRRGGDFLPSTRQIEIYVFPEERLKIKGKMRPDAVLEYTVRGSRLMKDYTNILSQTLGYELQIDSNEFRLIAAMEQNAPLEEQERLFAHRRKLNVQIREIERAHIRNHPDRMSSGIFVMKQPLDSFPVYYERLSTKIKNGTLKPLFDQQIAHSEEYQAYLENSKKEFIGQPAPDFTLTDMDGKSFTLSAFDNGAKYMVLDFWGSWCGYCLVEIPKMKDYFEKYKDKLEIIGIACRDKEKLWKKAIAENELPWIQLFNDEVSPKDNVAVLNAIDGYPTKIILSPDKTVLARFVGNDDDFYRKLDELLK